jgi:hypothetical protein
MVTRVTAAGIHVFFRFWRSLKFPYNVRTR